jgi:hypothetical protein
MARGQKDALAATASAALTWVVRVTDESRVRFSLQAAAAVAWLAQEAGRTQCMATAGARGGLALSPVRAIPGHEDIVNALLRRPLTVQQASSALADYARFTAATWPVTVSRERSRFSLTLPEEARKLRLAPSPAEFAVVFASGEILEIWPASDWVVHIREAARSLARLRERAREQVADEADDA